MMAIINTDRLQLRPCRQEDLNALHPLWTAPSVRRYLFDDRVVTRSEAQTFIETSTATFAEHGYGIWLLFETGKETIIGFSGLLGSVDNSPSLIYGVRSEHWGRGYAREASAAVLAYCFEIAGLTRVTADVDEPNLASIRILQSLGMRQTMREVKEHGPLLYFEMSSRNNSMR